MGILALSSDAFRFSEKGKMQAYPKSIFKPPVSIIVPAYNNEKTISACLTSLFQSAAQYMGFCEIIAVDNGSSDYTYEMAWVTIQKCRRKWPHIRGKLVRHTFKLDRKEAVKTGVNKAFGTLIAIVDTQTCWKPSTLRELVEAHEKRGKAASGSATMLYKADTLRELLTWKTQNDF